MIKLEKTEVVGLEAAMRGMRNPKNSWLKSDSCYRYQELDDTWHYEIGEADHALAMTLANGGPVHGKYARMIQVYVDITAPLYWWKEFDTYKVGTVTNSCSTMHKIHAKEFELSDFSCEHLVELCGSPEAEKIKEGDYIPLSVLSQCIIPCLNQYRELYLDADRMRAYNDCHGADMTVRQQYLDAMKKYWWQMIQLLPSSYNQRRTVMLNYEVLAGIHKHRKDHKLDEWHEFCAWIDQLPYSEFIIRDKKIPDYIIREMVMPNEN